MSIQSITEKRCPKCKTTKPLGEFYVGRGKKPDGLTVWCKICVCRSGKNRNAIRKARYVVVAATIPFKQCSNCKEVKPCTDFPFKPGIRTGLADRCRLCTAQRRNTINASTPEQKAMDQKLYKAAIARDTHYRNAYGIGVKEYDEMLKSQGGVCAICLQPPGKQRLHVDHGHADDTVRGLLCYACNIVLGRWNDSPEIAKRAVDYLRKYSQLRLVV